MLSEVRQGVGRKERGGGTRDKTEREGGRVA